MDDLNQSTRMIHWLEEERRKDKTALTALQEKAVGLANDLTEMSRRFQALQAELVATQQALARIPQFDKLLDQFKSELISEMDRREVTVQKSMRESDQLRKVEAETLNRAITEVRKEIPRFKPLEDEFPMRRAEERRLADSITRLAQRLDQLAVRTEDRVQTVVYLEEGRRQDAKRLAQLEEANVNLTKRLDMWIGKTTLLEEGIQRIPPKIVEVAQRVQDQDKVLEELRLSDFRRSQEVKVFMEDVNRAVDPIPDMLAGYQADRQQMQELVAGSRQALDQVQAFRTRIDTRQGEMAEMQRIAEERLKKQVEEWQAEQEKRWKRQTLTWFEQWQEHDRVHETSNSRVDVLEQAAPAIPVQFKAIWEVLEEMAKVSVTAARHVAEGQQAALDKGRGVGAGSPRPYAGDIHRVPAARIHTE